MSRIADSLADSRRTLEHLQVFTESRQMGVRPDVWSRLREVVTLCSVDRSLGRVRQATGLCIEASGAEMNLAETCLIANPCKDSEGLDPVLAEVVGFRDEVALLMPYGEVHGICPGSLVQPLGRSLGVPVGDGLLGRVIDALGRPLDEKGPIETQATYPAQAQPPSPFDRVPIRETMPLGVRAIDALLTCGKGQRVGIFSGAGIGKSHLLGMIARNTEADVNVIALIGERGHEVQDFIHRNLGPAGLERSVVVVATIAEAPTLRWRGALVATAIAEYFRDQGRHVLLMMDSLTRFARAQGEIGAARGEPLVAGGLPPSAYAEMPRLLERAGTSRKGSITGLYSVLVEGDDHDDPVPHAAKASLDGHITLSRELSQMGWYPAIDIPASVSRLMVDLVPAEHFEASLQLRRWLATYSEAKDYINLGTYKPGASPEVDECVEQFPTVRGYLQQSLVSTSAFRASVDRLLEIVRSAEARRIGRASSKATASETEGSRLPDDPEAVSPLIATGVLGGEDEDEEEDDRDLWGEDDDWGGDESDGTD